MLQAITNFRDNLTLWKPQNAKNDFRFKSNSTYIGFQVTLKSTIEVMDFLTKKCQYSFLMTTRLNQDALEV